MNINGVYEHFKGNQYKVIGVCEELESDKKYVLYMPLYNDSGFWIREYEMFFEKIERDEKIIDRFKFIDSPNDEVEFLSLTATHSETLEKHKIVRVEKGLYKLENSNS